MPRKRKAKGPLPKSAKAQRTAEPTDVPMEQIDEEGDLVIRCLSDDQPSIDFLVNKHTVCLSSPVFRAMIGKKSFFLEKDLDTINLGGDADAMRITMHILHLQGHVVPQNVAFDQFYELAVICDLYDLRNALVAWPGECLKD